MMMQNRYRLKRSIFLAILSQLSLCISVQAIEISKTDFSKIDFNFELMWAAMRSEHSYAILYEEDNRVTWQEGFLKTGISGARITEFGEFFADASVITSFVAGDGDAAGFTTGEEGETSIEDLSFGWRNTLWDISIGRQNFILGDGWLINGDALNLGRGFEAIPGAPDFDRGGAYWLAARKAFEKTAVVALGGENPWRGQLFYLESGNPAQANMSLFGINMEHVTENAVFAALYLHGLNLSSEEATFLGLQGRDGQQTYSVRYQGNAGIEHLFLSAEYTGQSSGDKNRKHTAAWYIEAGWQFSEALWGLKPSLRFGEFDTGYDPLFYGFNRGYGTWFQGEVAANYAGPFNTDSKFSHFSLETTPVKNLTIGTKAFIFEGKSSSAINASEVDIYAEWWAHPALMISPLLGWYKPDASPNEGRIQFSGETNLYAQLTLLITF